MLRDCGRPDVLHGCDKPIPATGQRFDIAWTGRRIAQHFPKLVHGGVETVVEIHEGVGGPEFLAQLLASHHVASALQQQSQNLKRLLLQTKLGAVLAQFAGGEVELEYSKARDSAGVALEIGHDDGRPTTRSVALTARPLGERTISACLTPSARTIPPASTAGTQFMPRKRPACC